MKKRLVINGIVHKDCLKKKQFGWYDIIVCTREVGGIANKHWRKVQIVITIDKINDKELLLEAEPECTHPKRSKFKDPDV